MWFFLESFFIWQGKIFKVPKYLIRVQKISKLWLIGTIFTLALFLTLVWRGFVISYWNLFHWTREDIYNSQVLNKIFNIFKTIASISVSNALSILYYKTVYRLLLHCYVILVLSLLYSKLNMSQYWQFPIFNFDEIFTVNWKCSNCKAVM